MVEAPTTTIYFKSLVLLVCLGFLNGFAHFLGLGGLVFCFFGFSQWVWFKSGWLCHARQFTLKKVVLE